MTDKDKLDEVKRIIELALRSHPLSQMDLFMALKRIKDIIEED